MVGKKPSKKPTFKEFTLSPMSSGWGNSTTEEVKKMGISLARHTRGEEAEVIRHLIQRVSVTLMKVNSNLILNRSPNLNHPSIDGIE